MGKLSRTLLVVLSLLIVAQNVGAADYIEKQTGVAFPDAIAQFTRVEVQELSDQRLGVAIRYVVPGLAKADLFIFDLGMREIETGVASRLVISQFERMKRDIFTLQDRGLYSDVKSLGEPSDIELPRIGDLRLLHARPSYSERAPSGELKSKVFSHAYLTGYRNKFLKIRITYPVNAEEAGEKAAQQLLEGLRDVLRL